VEQCRRHVRPGALRLIDDHAAASGTSELEPPWRPPEAAPEPWIVFPPPVRQNMGRGSRRKGTFEMGDIDVLTAERDRIEGELRGFEKQQDALEKNGAELRRKSEAAAGDSDALAKLKIELDQLAEAKRENDRLIAMATKRLEEIETLIGMQEQSDMA
jgi:hypothetical protein